MAKDPAFLFYSSDFLIGTSLLTNEETGMYIKILCWLHQHGPVKKEVIENLVGKLSDNLSVKFSLTEDGYLFNERLSEEIEKRRKFTESRVNNGKMGGRKPVGKPVGKAKNNLPENENENINEIISKGGTGEFLWTSVVASLKNDFRWLEKFCRDKGISKPELDKKLDQFISDIELKEDYKDLKELKSHFTNWFNKNKNGKQSTGNTAAEKFAARVEHANRYSEDGAARVND